MVGQSRVENAPTGAALIVGMRSTGQQPLRVRVTVVGTDATISETIAPDRYTDVRIPLTDPTNTTFRIKVDWSADGRAEHRELDIAPRR
jgi:hypothetical protein